MREKAVLTKGKIPVVAAMLAIATRPTLTKATPVVIKSGW